MSLPLPPPQAKSPTPPPTQPVHFGSDAAAAALSADPPRFFTDASAGPGAGLTSAGMRRLAAGWEEQLRRLARTPDGQV